MKEKILLIEDEEAQRTMIAGELVAHDFEIIEASDGVDGLEQFKLCKPDLAVIDIQMPRMNGIELIRNIKKIDSDIPTIIVSGCLNTDTLITALNLGTSYIIKKPFSGSEICYAIRQCLQKKQHLDSLLQSAKMSSLGTLTASVAHELRNVLAPISGALYLRNSNTDPEEVKRYEQVIKDSLEHSNRIINNLLGFSRQRDMLLQVNLQALFETLITLFSDKLTCQDIRCINGIQDHHIEAIPDSLNMIFANLIDNAIYAMKGGGELRLKSHSQENQVCIQISDTGVGIPSSIQDRIFDHFFSTKGEEGNGIGLALVKKEVLRRGGDINIKSEIGVGSTFTVLFPKQINTNPGEINEAIYM